MKFNKIISLALALITVSGLMASQMEDEIIFRSGKHKRHDKHRKSSCSNESKSSSSKEHKRSSKSSCSKESRDHKHSSKSSCSKESKSRSCENRLSRSDDSCPRKHEALRVAFVDLSGTTDGSNAFTTITNIGTKSFASGFDVSIWAQLCHCLDHKCKFVFYPNDVTNDGFRLALADLIAGNIDVIGTSLDIVVPLMGAIPNVPGNFQEANFNWIVSRLCNATGVVITPQVRAYAFRRDCCQLVRDVQECLNALICDAAYYRTARLTALNFPGTPTIPGFSNNEACIPPLYDSFSLRTVNETCICCTFPHRPCIKVPCEIPFSVPVTLAPTRPVGQMAH